MSKAPPAEFRFAPIAEAYARDVVAGKIPNCKWVKLACKRHLDDLKASADPDYPYKFSVKLAERVCTFVEMLPHVKGEWAQDRKLFKLSPWQVFILACIFGWVRKRDDRRRFRVAYIKIPRKNGKSLLAAAIGLYMLTADDEQGAEVYAGATTRKQAMEVFGPAKAMLSRTPELQEAAGAEARVSVLIVEATLSKFEPIIGNPGDGSSPSCALIDEYHEHDTPNQVDTMQTGMGARREPLLLKITTAGFNLAGPCYDDELFAQKVLEGTIDDPQLFALMYGIDDTDDWASPGVLMKANPNYGVSVDAEFLESQQRQAVINAGHQTKFRTKHLNEWCGAGRAWMPLAQWKAAADSALTIDELVARRCDCWVSLDLASKLDLCAEQILFREMLGGLPHFYVFGRYWLPGQTVRDAGKNKQAYERWVRDGWLVETDGATIDYDTICEQVVSDIKQCQAGELVYDPFNAGHLQQMVSAEVGDSVEVIEFVQKPWNFAVPMDEVLAALKDGRFHHDGNPITQWCMSNVVAKPAKKDMYSPGKEKPEQKIDGAVALFMAMARGVADIEPQGEPSVRWA